MLFHSASSPNYGGEGGIRTHGRFIATGTQGQRLKPLSHSSEIWRRESDSNRQRCYPHTLSGRAAYQFTHLAENGGGDRTRTCIAFTRARLSKPLACQFATRLQTWCWRGDLNSYAWRFKLQRYAFSRHSSSLGVAERSRTAKPEGLSFRGIPIPFTATNSTGGRGGSRTHKISSV